MRKQLIIALAFFLAVFLISVFLISAVSAELWFIDQPKSLYNIGDELEISVSVSEPGNQLETELVCDNESKMIFLKHLGNQTTVDIIQPLTKNFLGNLKGGCEITGTYGRDYSETTEFKISDSVSLEVWIDKLMYSPGEEINLKGEAVKENTLLLEGFFEFSFPEANLNTTGSVEKGKFEFNFTLPDNMAAGGYLTNVAAYDKEEEKIANIGKTKLAISVKQIPKEVDAALNSQNVEPGNNLSFRVMLYDQSGKMIKEEASFIIEDPDGNSLMKSLTKVDKSESFFIEKNLLSGYYKIKAYSAGIYGERQFNVEENEEAEFKIINETIMIKNIGNIKYNKAIQIKIENIVEVVNAELEVGEEKKYILAAPDGTYDVIITDGKKSLAQENIMLTGSAISVKELKKGFLTRNKSLAWFFLIMVIGMFVFVTSRRVLKKKFILSDRPLIGKGKEAKGAGILKVGKGKDKAEIKKDPREAEHSLVLKGHKQDTALICLKIKNELNKTAKGNLEKALRDAKETQDVRIVTYKSGDCTLAIFSPLITRTFKNHLPAVKTALDISRTLQGYNKKFENKIDFGISVHSGEMVNSLQDNKLKFTGLGNTLALAKKVAEISKGEVLLSKDIHEKTLQDVKAEKQEKFGLEVFSVDKITDSKRNRVYIQDFLKRMAEAGKKKKKK